MRIAQVAPLYESVPPRLYGGTERAVAHLTNELVRRGHEVTLFASGDSETLADLVPCRDRALRLDRSLVWDVPANLLQMERVLRSADRFDLIHFHTEVWHMPFFRACAHRTVTTLHGRLDVRDLALLCAEFPDYPLVSISDEQRRPLPNGNWVGTVHHGYPRGLYEFSPRPKAGYLAFLGRISPEKGPHRAIEIATRAGHPLVIAAKVDSADREFHTQVVEPLLDHPLVSFVGEIGEAEKSGFLGNASALLCPIDWPEPFGLVMIEAMACGTPVIAFRRGSVPELIKDGVTGFIVGSVEEAVQAVRRIGELDRRRIRAEFEARFCVERMADEYLAIYERVLAGAAVPTRMALRSGSEPLRLPAQASLPAPHEIARLGLDTKTVN